jgi:hypothetical protein
LKDFESGNGQKKNVIKNFAGFLWNSIVVPSFPRGHEFHKLQSAQLNLNVLNRLVLSWEKFSKEIFCFKYFM